MRLTPTEVAAISQVAAQLLDPSVKVYLFGSRADDERKGGDIDLLIMSEATVSRKIQRDFIILLQRHLGERKFDVVWRDRACDEPFVQHILEDGLLLWEKK